MASCLPGDIPWCFCLFSFVLPLEAELLGIVNQHAIGDMELGAGTEGREEMGEWEMRASLFAFLPRLFNRLRNKALAGTLMFYFYYTFLEAVLR